MTTCPASPSRLHRHRSFSHSHLLPSTFLLPSPMESNKDEALRCFAIAEKYFSADNLTAARKFCAKSISLFGTPQAEKLLVRINAADANPSTSSSTSGGSASSSASSSTGPSTTSSATEEHPSAAGMKHRHHSQKAASSTGTANGSAKQRDYTPEQHAVVKRVRGCKVTEYYEILAVKKDCEEADIKKAYRKVRVL